MMTAKRWILISGTVALLMLGVVGNALAADATASASPPSAPNNATVTLSGSGWLPGEVIEIFFGGDIQNVIADASGNFSTPWTVPSIPVGSHPLDFTGNMGSIFSTSFEVTSPPPTTTTTTTAAPTTTTQAVTTTVAATTTVAPTTTDSVTTPFAPADDGGGGSLAAWVLIGVLLAAVLMGGAFMMGRSTRGND